MDNINVIVNRTKNRAKVLTASVSLVIAILLSGCGESSGGYRIIARLSSGEYAIAFRPDDRLGLIVGAALEELVAEGTVAELSRRWFGQDKTLLKGNADALLELSQEIEIPAQRTLIVGTTTGAPPMCYRDERGNYSGFDIELARLVAEKLGWFITFQTISPDNVRVELISGNVDCAWGSMSFDRGDTKIAVSASYMSTDKVLVTRRDTSLRTKLGMRGKDLGLTYDPNSLAALQGDERLANSINAYIRYQSTDLCFDALWAGECDAIIVDAIAVEYYGR